jgi:hypothetical protein
MPNVTLNKRTILLVNSDSSVPWPESSIMTDAFPIQFFSLAARSALTIEYKSYQQTAYGTDPVFTLEISGYLSAINDATLMLNFAAFQGRWTQYSVVSEVIVGLTFTT